MRTWLSLALALVAGSALGRLVSKHRGSADARLASRSSYAAIVVMGPSGCGKSTLARALAAQTGRLFAEGDDHHPPDNIAKLASGVPLTEEDRKPFLDSIGRTILESRCPAAVSCSALRFSHRERLRSYAEKILFVWIDVPVEELRRRLRQRPDHFMPSSQLADQLAAFEPPAPPEDFIRIDGSLPVPEQLQAIVRAVGTDARRGQYA